MAMPLLPRAPSTCGGPSVAEGRLGQGSRMSGAGASGLHLLGLLTLPRHCQPPLVVSPNP